MRHLSLLVGIALSATVFPEPSLAFQAVSSETVMRLPRQPQISPDGAQIAFNWQDDLWLVASQGGEAQRLTIHPASDDSPVWTPDGRALIFRSDRTGGSHLYRLTIDGGAVEKISTTTHGDSPIQVTADGQSLLVLRSTDRHFHWAEKRRPYLVSLDGSAPDRMLLDVGVADVALSPDGNQLLFQRGRASWSRKGYRGAAALQLWSADLTQNPPVLRRLDSDREDFQNVSWESPLWSPDGRSVTLVSEQNGARDLYTLSLESGELQRLTDLGAEDRSDDGALFVSQSRNGQTLVFRRRFDLMRFDRGSGQVTPLVLTTRADTAMPTLERLVEDGASEIAFTSDGKQMAFVAGQDLYVMDRVLREPVRVTRTPHEESSPVFSSDDQRLYFVSDASGEVDIWEATHSQGDNIWWLAEDFTLRRVTDDAAVESGLSLSPKGGHLAYRKGTNLHVMDDDGSDERRVVEAWDAPDFDWSPDGRWLVYATDDDDYNPDVWIVRIDGTREPFNLSRHPDWDVSPRWSPDGTRIAFVSRRMGTEADVYYLNLQNEEEEQTERDRKLEEARKAMEPKGGKSGKGKAKAEKDAADEQPEAAEGAKEPSEEKPKQDNPEIEIDWEGIHDRMHRIAIPDSFEGNLIWSPDGKKLAFTASIDGDSGLYYVEFPEVEKPKKLAGQALRSAQWLGESKEIVGLAGSTPAAMSEKGKLERFDFRVRLERNWPELRQIAFDQAWRAMRDRFYDPSMNHRDWKRIRERYRPVAAQCLGASQFSHLMNMMLGELNASHMGHSGARDGAPSMERSGRWEPRTHHLGLRFDAGADGPGLLVESVIPKSPAARERSRILAGERILSVDGHAVASQTDLDRRLTLPELRDVKLGVQNAAGEEREVVVRPVTSVAGLLYHEFVANTRAEVERLSQGRLGYLHIRGMNMGSFRDMEEALYDAGHGKEGLVIDVRFNGGGSTTDHVLTALTQPVHAITQSRGSGEGYPQDRKVYASWSKPIVLLCNEHSFSNAEILAHAIQQIGRGTVVGMRTAGGVISTGSARLVDGSRIRMPTRGWYLMRDGSDMELNGCLPDIALWNEPLGPDAQLARGVEALLAEVEAEKAKPKVELTPAADLRKR